METPDLNSWPAKLVIRASKKLRSNKSYREENIRREEMRAEERRQSTADRYAARYGWVRSYSVDSRQDDINELGERKYSQFSQASTLVNNRDDTEMLHGLAHHDSFESLLDHVAADQLRDPHFDSRGPNGLDIVHPKAEVYRGQFARLPESVWDNIVAYLSAADAASLVLSLKLVYEKLGSRHLLQLDQPDQKNQKIALLHRLDRHYPRHLLCHPCAKFHLRTRPAKEVLKADYVANPIFACPNTRLTYLPRMRLVHGRELPYSFVNLATRGDRHSIAHGISVDALARRWLDKGSGWSHETRYIVYSGRLLLRVVSRAYALPSAEMTETAARHLLFDREEYIPFFSVCAHWRDGDLIRICKCALSHVPSPPESYFQQLKKAPKVSAASARPNFIVRGCDECRPARRCPECPTEYLVEIQMKEDLNDAVRPFKHAIVVTRWSDLGDGNSPYTSPEWTAITGTNTDAETAGYESFSQVGRRAVGGIFESRVNGSPPGQRLVSLNPKNQKLGEEGHGWY